MWQEQEQPKIETYDIGFLHLTENRPGREAGDPPFNPGKKAKYFEGHGGCFFFEDGVLVVGSIPEEEDGVNFPDVASFGAYVVAPTVAMRGSVPLPAEQLSGVHEAIALMTEMGGGGFGDDGAGSVMYGAEVRRCWGFQVAGSRVLAGLMLAAKNGRGVGHPGHWEGVVWKSDAEPAAVNVAAWGLPCRGLKSNEEIVKDQSTIVGFTWKVRRTDMGGVGAPAGGGTATLDQVLAKENEIDAELEKFAEKLGVDIS